MKKWMELQASYGKIGLKTSFKRIMFYTPKSEIIFIEGLINQTKKIHTIKSKIGHAVLNSATTTTV